jgi:twitching motility protein PilT
MDWQSILRLARNIGASDVHFSTGETPWLRLDGCMLRLQAFNAQASPHILTAEDLTHILSALQGSCQLQLTAFHHLDFAITLPELGRFRVNAFQQARGPSLVLRLIPNDLPTLDSLQAPACLRSWATQASGLILVTGPTGCGKSTLLAALLQHINTQQTSHILTLEDPIECVHAPVQCLIQQRELGRDTPDFESGLRAALREDPDVILIGELRDATTIRLALTAAETGHLVLSSLHTASAPQAIDRWVDAFPSGEKEGVRTLFADCLVGILAQTLCPHASGTGRVAAHEVMVATSAVRNLVREGKVGQLYSQLQTGQSVGMQTLDQSLLKLFRQKKISLATLQEFSKYPQNLNLMDNLQPERVPLS